LISDGASLGRGCRIDSLYENARAIGGGRDADRIRFHSVKF
jgi:hypothetical protein